MTEKNNEFPEKYGLFERKVYVSNVVVRYEMSEESPLVTRKDLWIELTITNESFFIVATKWIGVSIEERKRWKYNNMETSRRHIFSLMQEFNEKYRLKTLLH